MGSQEHNMEVLGQIVKHIPKKLIEKLKNKHKRRHCQKSAAGKNNSFPIHCSRSKHNCVFMKFLDFRTFGSGISMISLTKNLFLFHEDATAKSPKIEKFHKNAIIF